MACRPAICSHSLGRASVHSLPTKLDQAAKYGLDIELFYEDLETLAQAMPDGATPANLLAAAHQIHALCQERGISIICLQPFMHYEGLRDRQKHRGRIEEMKLWIELAHALDTDLIGIPSTCGSTAEMSGDLDLIVRDLQEVADLGAPSRIRFAYESLAWGTYSDTWEQAWLVVRRVDRGNFGICLDTFNIAARVYADPAAANGKNENAEEAMAASLERMVRTVDVRKIFFLQVVDAQLLSSPLLPGHKYFHSEQPARMSWSRNCRLFYGETDRGAYLPIKPILKAIVTDLGFTGYLSAELFNESLYDEDESVPAQHAQRAALSWRRICQDLMFDNPSRRVSSPRQEYDMGCRAQL